MNKLELFTGPCVIEDQALLDHVASFLVEQLPQDEVQITFKASFDKANRTSIDSFRGPGLEQGLKMLEKVKKDFNLPLITDFHLPEQADEVASVVDTIQIPAFLCRQTDMIVAGAKACKKYNRRLKIKKGQFISPYECQNIVNKAESELPKDQILLTERGSSFGYNNLVVDMASFDVFHTFGVKAIFDATHSVQQPGGLGNQSGGQRQFIKPLARAATSIGIAGLFIETHDNPDSATRDGACI